MISFKNVCVLSATALAVFAFSVYEQTNTKLTMVSSLQQVMSPYIKGVINVASKNNGLSIQKPGNG